MIKVLINNGAGVVDYTQYVVAGSLKIEDSINVPTVCSLQLDVLNNAFVVPIQMAYIQIFSTKYNKYLFTGFVANAPSADFQGSGQGLIQFKNQRYVFTLNCTSDEYLLNCKAVPFFPAYVSQTMGGILKLIANVLAPGFFDTSLVQDGQIIPYYQYDPTVKWSDLAKQFGDATRFRYQAINKQIIFEPYGNLPLGVTFDDTGHQGTFDPLAFKANVLTVPMVNDAIVFGNPEPQNIHEDYFVGDGLTGQFPFRHQAFNTDDELLLSEDWTEQSGQFSTQLWTVEDPFNQFSLGTGALLMQGVEGSLGQSYIQANNGVELGGHLVLQHGQFTFFDRSTGLVGGVYSQFPYTQQNSVLGFQISNTASVGVSLSGASGIQIAPMVSGGLLQNLLVAPLALENPAWLSNNIVRPTGPTILAPDGTMTAEALTISVSGVNTQIYQIYVPNAPGASPIVGQPYTFSVWLKVPSGTMTIDVVCEGNPYPEGVTENAVVVTTEWQRFQATVVPTGTATGVAVFLFNPQSAGVLHVWGSQLNGGTGASPFTAVNSTGPFVVTKINHQYMLVTYLTAQRYTRYEPVYRTLAGTVFGDNYLPAQAVITFTIWDIDQNQPWAPTQTKYTVTAPMPSFGFYVPINSENLNCSLVFTQVSQPPLGLLTVQSLYGPTGTALPLFPPPGPPTPFQLGFGYGEQVATIQATGTIDQLSFYQDTLPAAGSRILIKTWEEGQSVGRVRDPVSIAAQAEIVGDDGVRSAIITQITPEPRTSGECELAASAYISDHENPQFQGSYAPYDYFWDNTKDYPRSGRFLNVTSPARGISGAQFLVNKLEVQFVELRGETLIFTVSFGQDTQVSKLLTSLLPTPSSQNGTLLNQNSILDPTNTANAPNPQLVAQVGEYFIDDLIGATVTGVSGTQITIDLGAPPVTGCEIRRLDLNWGVPDQNRIALITVQQILLPRITHEQIWYLRQVNGPLTSRFSNVIRVVAPMIPSAPQPSLQIIDPLNPTVLLGLNGYVSDIASIEVRASDDQTVLLQRRLTSESDLYYTYTNSPPVRNIQLYARFANLMWEYSPRSLVNISLPAPLVTMSVDDQSVVAVATASGAFVDYIEMMMFSSLSGAQATMRGGPTIDFQASGAQAGLSFSTSGVQVASTTFSMTARDFLQLRYLIGRAADAIGTGPWSQPFKHLYVAQPVTQFVVGDEINNVGFPPSVGSDPTFPSSGASYAATLSAQSWKDYLVQISRQQRG